MATRVLLTVDTELTWRHHRAGATWHDNFERSYDPAGVGVPYQLRTLAAHGLKACFFVDPMPALLHGLEPIRRMVAPILEAGQEVQLHLHPCWQGAAAGEAPVFELTDFAADAQLAMIAAARDLLVAAGAPNPVAFRSGSYAVDANTLAALAALGIRYDSSHNGSHGPWPSALPLAPGQIAPVVCGGVVEVPVTQIRDRGGLRHLQVCAVSSREMEAALLHAQRHGHSAVTIVSHSFELAARSGLRPNAILRRRFERLCRFLAERADSLPTAWFADLPGMVLGAAAEPLPANALRSVRRMAEQIWSDGRYERPPLVARSLAPGSIVGVELFGQYIAS